MKIKSLISGLLVSIAVFSQLASAQQPVKVFRIGVLSSRSAMEPRDEVFRQRLREQLKERIS